MNGRRSKDTGSFIVFYSAKVSVIFYSAKVSVISFPLKSVLFFVPLKSVLLFLHQRSALGPALDTRHRHAGHWGPHPHRCVHGDGPGGGAGRPGGRLGGGAVTVTQSLGETPEEERRRIDPVGLTCRLPLYSLSCHLTNFSQMLTFSRRKLFFIFFGDEITVEFE